MNQLSELQLQVDELNKRLGTSIHPYAAAEKGHKAQVGNYHLSYVGSKLTLRTMIDTHGNSLQVAAVQIDQISAMTHIVMNILSKDYV